MVVVQDHASRARVVVAALMAQLDSSSRQ